MQFTYLYSSFVARLPELRTPIMHETIYRPTAEEFTMATTAEQVAGSPTTATTWNIDSAHTNVEFGIRHLMISTARGRFDQVTGSATVDSADPSAITLDVSIGVASIDTRQAQRDAHLRSPDFFDVERFPVMRFVGTRVDGNIEATFTLTGQLTIRDITRPLVLHVTAEGRVRDPWGNERAGFSATGRIDRRAYGLTWNQALEAGGVVVGDEVKIAIDVELTRAA
jgi:polyisoprenoid-binding protein YceI